MKLNGRRESKNVEDRRGMSSGTKIGLSGGLGAIVLAVIGMFLSGGSLDLGSLLQQVAGLQTTQQEEGSYQGSAEEEELASFSKKIEASTEDIWTALFKQEGLGQYEAPTLVLYSGQTSTACGNGSSAMGPFYCGGDQKLYIDLSFFESMQQQLGAGGELSYAYVIAHEVGHHVEYLTGQLAKAHNEMASYGQSSAEANRISVRLELLADFYAGVWAHHENQQFQSIEDGELEEAIDCAMKIGDDYLQKKAGYNVTMPEQFTHGTSAQRMRWFKKGYTSGDMSQGNTFSVAYDKL